MEKFEFSKALRVLKAEKMLTSAQVAEVMSVSEPTISGWLNGKVSPRIDDVAKMCRDFRISLVDFIQWGM